MTAESLSELPASCSEPTPATDLAEWFNSGCACVTLDRGDLADHLAQQLDQPTAEALVHHFPGLFSNVALFLPTAEFRAMQQVIDAVETVAALPAYQQQVLAHAPAIAHRNPGASGVFMGYDFHRAGDHPKLIEINTNAGGAFLNAALRRSQQACCPEMATLLWPPASQDFAASVLAMFGEEWARQRADAPLQRIAIVDEQPRTQFLYPEFLLAQQLFRQHGIDTVITDPSELQLRDNRLYCGDQPIDLVYNRLTDFLLDQPAHAALREAYQRDAVVLTPNPHVYALFADKRNLIALGNRAQLQRWQLPEAIQNTLCQSIPETVAVSAANADQLWQQRKQWFFKPARGFGSTGRDPLSPAPRS